MVSIGVNILLRGERERKIKGEREKVSERDTHIEKEFLTSRFQSQPMVSIGVNILLRRERER